MFSDDPIIEQIAGSLIGGSAKVDSISVVAQGTQVSITCPTPRAAWVTAYLLGFDSAPRTVEMQDGHSDLLVYRGICENSARGMKRQRVDVEIVAPVVWSDDDLEPTDGVLEDFVSVIESINDHAPKYTFSVKSSRCGVLVNGGSDTQVRQLGALLCPDSVPEYREFTPDRFAKVCAETRFKKPVERLRRLEVSSGRTTVRGGGHYFSR